MIHPSKLSGPGSGAVEPLRYVVNWRFAGLLSLALFVVTTGGFVWVRFQTNRNAGVLLARADLLEREEDWAQAAAMLHRYLTMQPGDDSVRVRLARSFDKSATTARAKLRAAELYAQALAVAPQDRSLRTRQAELLLETGQAEEARKRVADLLAVGEGVPAAALRVEALGLAAAAGGEQGPRRGPAFQTAADALRIALDAQPGDVEMSSLLAGIYRHELLAPSEAERIELADRIIEQMVAANQANAQAYFVRYGYRSRYLGADADAESRDALDRDLDRALELAPDDFSVLLASGQRAANRKELDLARHYYDSAIKIEPDNRLGYLRRGEVELAVEGEEGRRRAVEIWRRGLDRADPLDVELNLQLAASWIELGELDTAQGHISTLELRLGSLPERQRLAVRSEVDLLRGSIAFSQREFGEAITHLRRSLQATDEVSSRISQATRAQVCWQLARSHAALGQWDLAAAEFEQVADLVPGVVDARQRASRAWLAAGQTERAIQQANLAIAADESRGGAHLDLARALFVREGVRPAGERDWQLVRQAMEKAKAAGADPVRVGLLEADLAMAQQRPEDVIRKLESLRDQNPDSQLAAGALAIAHHQLGDTVSAEAVLGKLGKQDNAPFVKLVVETRRLVQEGKFAEAASLLEEAQTKQAGDLPLAIQHDLAQLKLRAGQRQAARTILENITKKQSRDLAALVELAEVVSQDGDWKQLQTLETKLRELEGEQGTNWRRFRAQRLLASATSAAERTEAEQLVREIQAMRPDWPKTHLLIGEVALRQNQVVPATDAYRKAIELGERGSLEWTQLLRLLTAQGQWDEARQVLRRVEQHLAEVPPLAEIAIRVYLAKEEQQVARQLAQQVASRFPNLAATQIQLAETLMATGENNLDDRREAEKALTAAIELAPEDARAWIGLVRLHQRAEQAEQLERTMDQLAANAAIPPSDRMALVAQLRESLGEREKAEAAYLRGLELAPESAAMHFLAGRFFSRREPSRAEALFRRALNLAPSSEAAIRALGSVLVRRGDPRKRDEAIRLLAGLSSQTASDRILLARAYEMSDQAPKANELLRPHVLKPDASPQELGLYVQFCVDNRLLQDAEAALRQLEAKAPHEWATISLRVKWLAAMNRFHEADLRLTAWLESRPKDSNNPSPALQLDVAAARLYDELGMKQKAEPRLQKIAELGPFEYRFLADWLARNERIDEAVALCIGRSKSIAASEAAQHVVILCRTLIAGNAAHDAHQEAEALVARTLQANPEHVELLAEVANLRLQQGLSSAAEDLFRRVLSLDTDNVVALNNLAILVADYESAKQEALTLIDRALEKGGDIPPLLSTKGYVLLCLGKAESARDYLWETLAASDQDPRYYLYLAKAHLVLGEVDSARLALERVFAGKLPEELLTQREREWFVELRDALKLAHASQARRDALTLDHRHLGFAVGPQAVARCAHGLNQLTFLTELLP